MKNKLFISIYCGLMILLASCNNYLDVKPKGKIIPKTAEDFSTIIHYWLDQIEKGRDDVIIPNPEVMTTLEMFADDLNATLASNFGYTSIYVGSAINKNQATYKTLYSVIKDCNMVIGNMDDIYRCLGNHAEFQVFGKDYVINQNHVRSQTKKSIQLSNGETLTCSSLQNLPLLGKLLFS